MPWADLNYNHVCAGNETSLQYFFLCYKAHEGSNKERM